MPQEKNWKSYTIFWEDTMRLKPETNLLLVSVFLIVAIMIAGTPNADIEKCEKLHSRETCLNELRP